MTIIQLEASMLVCDEKTEEELDDPYYQIEDGSGDWVPWNDVQGADWKDTDGQIEAAFTVAREGTGDLVQLCCGDDEIWVTTTDKIKKSSEKVNG